MRILALSDIHTDYDENARWVADLSLEDYRDDVLILAGDISDSLRLLAWTLSQFVRRFRQVVFVPGNHDLWVLGDNTARDSLEKFAQVQRMAADCGACTGPWATGATTIVPLQGWYDSTFGEPAPELRAYWMDYRACRWPAGMAEPDIARHFLGLNQPLLHPREGTVISCSHFVPRIDVMPDFIPAPARRLYPVLGSDVLEAQVRRLGSTVHVYGHSHVNRRVLLDGVTYVNNAFGYPSEKAISARSLVCVHEA